MTQPLPHQPHLTLTLTLPPSGVEDIFKVLRRLTKKGSENNKIALQRLYQMGHLAAQTAFPNILQESWGWDCSTHRLKRRGI
jgi:hypothetical protein